MHQRIVQSEQGKAQLEHALVAQAKHSRTVEAELATASARTRQLEVCLHWYDLPYEGFREIYQHGLIVWLASRWSQRQSEEPLCCSHRHGIGMAACSTSGCRVDAAYNSRVDPSIWQHEIEATDVVLGDINWQSWCVSHLIRYYRIIFTVMLDSTLSAINSSYLIEHPRWRIHLNLLVCWGQRSFN